MSALPGERLFVCDASREQDGLTGIGVVIEEPDCRARPFAAFVTRTENSTEAELRAMAHATLRAQEVKTRQARFWTDSTGVKRMVRGEVAELRVEPALVLAIRNRIELHPGWDLEVRKRSDVSPAHALARLALRVHKQATRGIV